MSPLIQQEIPLDFYDKLHTLLRSSIQRWDVFHEREDHCHIQYLNASESIQGKDVQITLM